MSEIYFEQSSFTAGELDPKLHARTNLEFFYSGAKQIRNGLVIPQGGACNRFGTTYVDSFLDGLSNPITNHKFVEATTITYDDSSIYLQTFQDLSLKIYLENIKVATVATTINKELIPELRFCEADNRLIATHGNNPIQIIRSQGAPNNITAVDTVQNFITVTNPTTAGFILPVIFETTGALPTTNPQIRIGVTYFIKAITTNNLKIYSTPTDAVRDENAYAITALGNNSSLRFLNTWTISDIVFKFMPAYDFNGGYSGLTFTPSATTGAVTLTASGAIFTNAMIGGLFRGNNGILRITGFTSATVVSGTTIEDFASTAAIDGKLAFLGEPAWSAARGFPRYVGVFQRRLVLAGSVSIPNGVWLSVINDAYNFDDSQTLDDDAISWYPASGSTCFIRGITSGRSLIIHTNTGNYSSQVLQEAAVTPKNFVLNEQNKIGCSNIQPVFIDNQMLLVDSSGNNVISMVWDINQSSYVTDNKSIISSELIQKPIDMASFAQPAFTDGFYCLFVNSDGTLAVLQTLREQNVSAFTLSNTKQNYTDGFFRKVASSTTSSGNRCWFVVERKIATNHAPTPITGTVDNVMTSVGHGIPVGTSSLIMFTTGGILPSTTPQIDTSNYFWGRAITANTFKVYSSKEDADADTNAFQIHNVGNASNVQRWTDETFLNVEEVDFSVYSDCSFKFTNVGGNTITGMTLLRGQTVKIKADGTQLPDQRVPSNGILVLPVSVTNVDVGLGYESKLVPLPIALPQVPGSLYRKKHIRNFYVKYYNSLGFKIQGYGVPTIEMQDVILGATPEPKSGTFSFTPMEGWSADDYEIAIVQDKPFPMTILGIAYIVEI